MYLGVSRNIESNPITAGINSRLRIRHNYATQMCKPELKQYPYQLEELCSRQTSMPLPTPHPTPTPSCSYRRRRRHTTTTITITPSPVACLSLSRNLVCMRTSV